MAAWQHPTRRRSPCWNIPTALGQLSMSSAQRVPGHRRRRPTGRKPPGRGTHTCPARASPSGVYRAVPSPRGTHFQRETRTFTHTHTPLCPQTREARGPGDTCWGHSPECSTASAKGQRHRRLHRSPAPPPCPCGGAAPPSGPLTGSRPTQGSAQTHSVGLEQVQEEVQLLHHIVLLLSALESRPASPGATHEQTGRWARAHRVPRQGRLCRRALPHDSPDTGREVAEPEWGTRFPSRLSACAHSSPLCGLPCSKATVCRTHWRAWPALRGPEGPELRGSSHLSPYACSQGPGGRGYRKTPSGRQRPVS